MSEFMQILFSKQLSRKKVGLCPFCGKKVNPAEFKDELSLREFGISGLCQECQDKFFAEPEDRWLSKMS